MLQDEKCRVGGSVGRGAHATWSDASTDWGAGVPCHFEGGFPSPVRGPSIRYRAVIYPFSSSDIRTPWVLDFSGARARVVGDTALWDIVLEEFSGPRYLGLRPWRVLGTGVRCWRFLARRVSNCSALIASFGLSM